MGGYDSIWVVMNRFTKSAYFISVRVKYTIEKLVELYILCDCMESKFLYYLIEVACSLPFSRRHYNMVWVVDKILSTTFHPHRDGQPEQMI